MYAHDGRIIDEAEAMFILALRCVVRTGAIIIEAQNDYSCRTGEVHIAFFSTVKGTGW